MGQKWFLTVAQSLPAQLEWELPLCGELSTSVHGLQHYALKPHTPEQDGIKEQWSVIWDDASYTWTGWIKGHCHAKSVAWTNHVNFPGNYNVSNGVLAHTCNSCLVPWFVVIKVLVTGWWKALWEQGFKLTEGLNVANFYCLLNRRISRERRLMAARNWNQS